MSKYLFVKISAATFVSFLVVACSPPTLGDVVSNAVNSGPQATVSTSVGGSRTLGSLSDSEAYTYCDDLNKYLESHPDEGAKSSCLLLGSLSAFGVSAANATATCKDEYGKCIAKDPGAIQIMCSQLTPEFTDCKATVAEYSQCRQDATNAARDISADSCNRFMSDAGSSSTPSRAASCKAISDKCPGL